MSTGEKKVLALMAALLVALLGAIVFSLGVYALATVPSDADLSGWQAVAVAWGIIGVMAGALAWVGSVFLATWAFT